MSYGCFSDDPLEDFVFRDDGLRMQKELDKGIQENASSEIKGSKVVVFIFVGLIVVFLICFFVG